MITIDWRRKSPTEERRREKSPATIVEGCDIDLQRVCKSRQPISQQWRNKSIAKLWKKKPKRLSRSNATIEPERRRLILLSGSNNTINNNKTIEKLTSSYLLVHCIDCLYLRSVNQKSTYRRTPAPIFRFNDPYLYRKLIWVCFMS
jgi:hypothetical protein